MALLSLAMRHWTAGILALILLVSLFDLVPSTKAPFEEQTPNIGASIFAEPTRQSITPLEKQQQEEHTVLISLLEQYVEEKRDLPKAQEILDQTLPTETNQKILELYQGKILARSLAFQEAALLLDQINHQDLVLMKASVLIALEEREKASQYLHGLVESHPDPNIKLAAASLLNVYQEFDRHQDTQKSYLWTLFAQKMGDFGEYEISHYLARKALEANEGYRDAWIIKGFNEFNLKRFEEAESSLLSAYQLDPGNGHIQYLLGMTYFELEKAELSSQYLLYAEQNGSPYEGIIWEKLAENAMSLDDYALGAHYYEQVRERHPENLQALSRLIWVYGEHLDQISKSEALGQLLEKLAPDDPNTYELLSWIASQQNQLERAATYLEMADGLR